MPSLKAGDEVPAAGPHGTAAAAALEVSRQRPACGAVASAEPWDVSVVGQWTFPRKAKGCEAFIVLVQHNDECGGGDEVFANSILHDETESAGAVLEPVADLGHLCWAEPACLPLCAHPCAPAQAIWACMTTRPGAPPCRPSCCTVLLLYCPADRKHCLRHWASCHLLKHFPLLPFHRQPHTHTAYGCHSAGN